MMFRNIQIDLIILKTYDQQFTLTTKKSLHIIFKAVWWDLRLASLLTQLFFIYSFSSSSTVTMTYYDKQAGTARLKAY